MRALFRLGALGFAIDPTSTCNWRVISQLGVIRVKRRSAVSRCDFRPREIRSKIWRAAAKGRWLGSFFTVWSTRLDWRHSTRRTKTLESGQYCRIRVSVGPPKRIRVDKKSVFYRGKVRRVHSVVDFGKVIARATTTCTTPRVFRQRLQTRRREIGFVQTGGGGDTHRQTTTTNWQTAQDRHDRRVTRIAHWEKPATGMAGDDRARPTRADPVPLFGVSPAVWVLNLT